VVTKLRQKGVALAAAAALVVTMTACGSNQNNVTAPITTDADPAAVTGTLRVLVPSYPSSNEGKAALQKVVDAFNKNYPKVTVEPDFATFDTLNQKISTSIAGGQSYDVLVTGIGWVPPFASKNVFADLSEVGVTKDSLSKTTNPALIPAGEYEGKIYAVPLIAGAKPLVLRKSLFTAAGLDPTKPPATFAELTAAAKKLTKTAPNGTITQAGFDFWAGAGGYRQDFVALLGALGQPLYKDGKPNFNTPEGKKALQFIVDSINTDKVIAFAQQNAAKQPMTLTGEAAMGFGGGYVDCSDKGVGKAVCDDLVYFNLKETTEAMFSGGQLASVGAKSTLKGAAWAFIQQLSAPDAQADIAALNFAVPASSSAKSAPIVTGNPASTFVADKLDSVVFEGGAANWLDLRNDFATGLDKAITGATPVDQVLSDLAAKSK
jgi:multiple sugar transport system substrate-binding protein